MKAAVFHAPNQPQTIEDVEIDNPGPREVLIRTAAAGLCHSDLHFIEGKYPTPVPTVLGHESAGIVEAVGRDVTYVKPGDHVITCLSVFCGHCEFCLTGHMSICQTPEVKMLPGKARRMRWKGAHLNQYLNLSSFAEQMLVHENAIVKIREDLPLDLGALIGLVLALAGVSLSVVTDDGRWDAYGTLAIGTLLGLIAIVLVVEMKSLLIGESANRKDIEAIRAAIEVEPDVIQIIHLKTEHLGPDELLVAAKVEFLHELTVAEVAATIDRVERTIRAGVPVARLIYLEPDVHRDHRAAAFVTEHEGHIGPDDPHYADITGVVAEDDDDPIWT